LIERCLQSFHLEFKSGDVCSNPSCKRKSGPLVIPFPLLRCED
jgi:hypothetical protein